MLDTVSKAYLTLTALWVNSVDDKLMIFFLFTRKETICMKCQILLSGKNKKNISKCGLLKNLPSMLSVNRYLDKTNFEIKEMGIQS